MPTHVRLKHRDKHRPIPKCEVTKLAYGTFNVPFTRIFQTNEGYKAICKDDRDADKLLTQAAKEEFLKAGIIVIMPPELRAKRSIFVRQVDGEVGIHSAQELKEDIERRNTWARINEVIKIKDYTHCFKIIFHETEMADKAIRSGFLTYDMSITPNQIQKEHFVSLLTCFNCYKFEEHTTKDCPNTDHQYCSNCAEIGHRYTECNNTEKMGCLNCKHTGKAYNTHRTMAMSCPIKKELIKTRTDEDKNKQLQKQDVKYVEIARRAVAEAQKPETNTILQLGTTSQAKIFTLIMHAHVQNIINPGTYATELNKLLVKNGLAPMWFPDNPESSKLFHATATPDLTQLVRDKNETSSSQASKQQDKATLDTEEATQAQTRDPRLQKHHQGAVPKPHSIDEHTQEACSIYSSQEQLMDFEATLEGIDSETSDDIGLTIFIPDSEIVPTNIDADQVLEKIKNNQYKYQYSKTYIEEDLVQSWMESRKIKIRKGDLKPIPESAFRKIRNGREGRTHDQQRQRKQSKYTVTKRS